MAGTRLFSDLVGRISPNAPGCPQPLVVNAVRDAAIEVCVRTGAWRYQHADVTTVDGTEEYAFVPEASAEVDTILGANIGNTPLRIITLEEALRLYPGYPSAVAAERATPRYLFSVSPESFHLAPVPDDGADLVRLFVTQKPTHDATGMDKTVLDKLETVVTHRALQYLLTQSDKPWSDVELAAYHAKQFVFKVSMHRAQANIGVGRHALTVQNVPWA